MGLTGDAACFEAKGASTPFDFFFVYFKHVVFFRSIYLLGPFGLLSTVLLTDIVLSVSFCCHSREGGDP